MKRLWVQLTLAFAAVVLVTVGAIAALAGLTAGRQFLQYLTYSGSPRQQELVDGLAGYYRVQGTWRGIEQLLDPLAWTGAPMPPGAPMPKMPRTMDVRDEALRIVLADGDGVVVYDGPGRRPGRRLSRPEASAVQEIQVDGRVVGLLVATTPVRSTMLGPLERIFVDRLRGLLVAGALVAGVVGVLLGVGLSRSLTAPLGRLAEAARAVAGRDFSRRVTVEGSMELAEVGQAFNEMTAALERSERQRQNLVADVAHELRTPLSVVQGSLRAILDDLYPLDKGEVARLYDETRLLSRLVGDLGELALADAGQLQLHLGPVDVAEVLRATVESLGLAAEAQKLSLAADLLQGEALPAVRADPDRLAQVVRNLAINALRHTPAGGAVTVSAARRGAELEVAVRDTGEGIAADDLQHVFERFWRAEPSRTRGDRAAGGSGLGLSVARSLVEAQGGRIWAESEKGKGSTFRFTVPLA